MRGRSDREILGSLGLTKEARVENAKHLVGQAKAHRDNAELLKAESALEQALGLDPSNVDAQRLMSEVRLLLGDDRGVTGSMVRDITERQRVAREQTRSEISG